MSHADSSVRTTVVAILKGAAVVACSQCVFAAGSFLSMMYPPGPCVVPFWVPIVSGAILCGLTAGCLTWLFGFRRWGVLLSPVFASVPLLFQWFVCSRRSRSSSYQYQGGKMVSIVKWHVDYSQLITMLVVACIVSTAAFLLCRAAANHRR